MGILLQLSPRIQSKACHQRFSCKIAIKHPEYSFFIPKLSYEHIERLRQTHPALKLLNADSQALIISFLYQVFIQPKLIGLLDELLPIDSVNQSEPYFSARCFLKQESPRIRFRCLDKTASLPFTDLTVPLIELAHTPISCDTVFITENKMNGLCFPSVSGAIVIFGLGFGVNLLNQISWLKHKRIYYWGDIDTHGFAMLSQLRKMFPQTKSFMMDTQTLMQFKHYWVTEQQPYHAALLYLTEEEQNLYQALCHNLYGTNVRLEQERIDYEALSFS